MNKCAFRLTAVLVTLVTATAPEDICESCVPLSKCPLYASMGRAEQISWKRKYPCNNQHPDDYGIPPGSKAAEGDFICCPNQIWGVDPKESHSSRITEDNRSTNYNKDNIEADNDANTNFSTNKQSDSDGGNQSPGTNLEPSRWSSPYTNMYWNDRPDRNKWDIGNQNFYHGNNNRRLFNNNRRNIYDNDQRGGRNNNYYNQGGRRNQPDESSNNNNRRNDYDNDQRGGRNNNYYNQGGRRNQPDESSNNNNRRNYYDNDQRGGRNNNFYNQGGRRNQPDESSNNRGSESNDNYYPSNRRSGNSFGKPGQCDRLTSSPPDPQSGCCGREASDDDRITDAPTYYDNNAPATNNYGWEREEPQNYERTYSSFKEEESNTLTINNNTVTVVNGTQGDNSTIVVENRISGGKETGLTQYPWTALLITTFQNGLQQTAFNCGGSLISSRYVLTAGHCVYDAEAVMKSVQVFVAEYDKRTFPRDCKITAEGRKCIDNISIFGEDVILHPRFDEARLQNDIALIRLQTDAPYTEYIRPICLPSINIDNPEHARLPLTVTGWGRNGQYKSDIKQSTTVHLVPQHDCRKFYPDLTTRHLCAAGYTGEDSCKGDSGGPLMVLYRGRFYVVGVVSGKRTDAPCGSTVPSLYTNVYHYLDWIRSNIRS